MIRVITRNDLLPTWLGKQTGHVLFFNDLLKPQSALLRMSLAQSVLYTLISHFASEPPYYVGSLISHVCGVPIHRYVIKFGHSLLLTYLMSI